MERKEFYKHNLPHFQQPGQAYFITWSLKDAVPKKALIRYTRKLELLKSQIQSFKSPGAAVSGRSESGAAVSEPLDFEKRESEFAAPTSGKIGAANSDSPELKKLKMEYYSLRKKYIKAYDDLLDAERNPKINLSKPEHTKVIIETLKFWEGVKLENYAFCVMPNHVHWVFSVFEKDKNKEPVYLQDILYSVKRFTANRINVFENRKGELWQKESFDTTIRDEKHLVRAIEYTLNNPVSAGMVKEWKDWPGCWGTANSDSPV